MEDNTNFDKCIDDTIIWDDHIEQNFYRVCQFLSKYSNGEMVFNPSKFQFAKRVVDYLGFKINDTGLKPQDSFREFPAPKKITNVRSWFGLINQISYSYATDWSKFAMGF